MECIDEQIVADFVPQILKPSGALVRLVPQERVQQKIVEKIVDLPVPRILEEIVAAVQIVPQGTHFVEVW